eukprot:gene13600-19473_t
MASIYRKCLKLSNTSMQSESTGKVVTLMSNDAQKVQDAMFAIHALWATPLFIIAVIILLWFQVKWATFVGLGIMLLLVPCTAFLAAKLGSYRRQILKYTEKRSSFQEKVQEQRRGEHRIMKSIALWQGVFGVIMFTGPVLVSIFCFGSYTLAGNTLSAANAYTALAYFSLLRFPMSFLPMLITMITGEDDEGGVGVEKGVVSVKDGEFCWDPELEKATLSNISFEAKPGTLTMIVGSVGSGKSSMLASLLGHITKRAGSVRIAGTVAYVAQTAWIMNDTLQENILMGSALDEKRYRMAIKSSQLEPDLKIMDLGDLTEIGDRGITLSGGQKQRVSIARAVYYDADIVLLDDPLSAVDSHVGRALFETCIRGPLKNKTVLLVTNALHHLPHADNIIWIDNNTIKCQGTYQELVANGLNIAELAHIDDEDAEATPDQESAGTKLDTAVDAIVKGKEKDLKDPSSRKSTDRKSVDIDSKLTLVRQAENGNKNLTGIEMREEGNVRSEVLKEYMDCGGGWMLIVIIGFLMAIEQSIGVWTNRWVGLWFSDNYDKSTGFYLGIYAVFGLAFGTATFVRSVVFLFTCVRAAVNLHNKLLGHVLVLPKHFFDTNPAGRVLNRFSRDTDVMDNVLSLSVTQFLNCIATYVATLIVIAIATVWFAIAIPPLTVIYVVIQRYYIPAARELQRIESITRSPIYTKFAEAMAGMTTIRAYRKEEHFTGVSDRLMETNAKAFVTQKLASAWLAMRLDIMGLAILTGTGALVIAGNVDPSLAGLAIMYALDLTRFLKQGTAMAAKSEADFNSVERIVQYLDPLPESAPDTDPEVLATMDPNWPKFGGIKVDNLHMRYRADMPLVLKGISFNINPGDKVGLVGRTGSGKSSLLLVMLRMIELEKGSIVIDGVDIATLGVRHLRSKMSVIPQDPFMFSGSVRTNLDPFGKSDDDILWECLDSVGLKKVISELEGKMDYIVADNGANFSLGQRQLFCMARAMLRKNRILMLDEATASVDLDTDNLLQTAIRIKFADCTMMTIAHRLNTIMDSDMCVVMDKGRVIECGEPHALLQADTGMFTSMVNMSGKSSSRYLKSLARDASSVRGSLKRDMSHGGSEVESSSHSFASSSGDIEGSHPVQRSASDVSSGKAKDSASSHSVRSKPSHLAPRLESVAEPARGASIDLQVLRSNADAQNPLMAVNPLAAVEEAVDPESAGAHAAPGTVHIQMEDDAPATSSLGSDDVKDDVRRDAPK